MKVGMGILALLIVLGAREWIRESYVATMATVATGGQSGCLQMLGSTTGEEDGRTAIVGNIRNNCGRKVPHATITFKLVPSGAVVSAHASDLKAGETRRFKTGMILSRNTIYRFDSISAF